MKRTEISDFEMGNLLFGHSRGEYCVEPRGDYQEIFQEFLFENGFDGYGRLEGSDEPEFENDTFIIRPYYWGEDEKEQILPNFVYKPTGVEIKWYKYPMRDAYCNKDISVEQFKRIIDECKESMQ